MDAKAPSRVLAERLRAIRKRRGWSAREVAERVAAAGGRLDRAAVSKIENFGRDVSLDEAFTLAVALDVAPVNLFVPVETGLPDDIVAVSPKWSVRAALAREWVRGRFPLPSQDSRVYWTEVPDEEWDAAEYAQRKQPPMSAPEEIKEFMEAAGGKVIYTPSEHDDEEGE